MPISQRWGRVVVQAICLALTLSLVGTATAWAGPPPDFDPDRDVFPTAVAPATCRSTDRVETGLQGEVPIEDRRSGRSTEGYTCNMDLVGQYQGTGAAWVSASYENCAYIGSTFQRTGGGVGVQAVDVSDPTHPRRTATLVEPAMINGTWESLKVNEKRGLLIGTGVPLLLGLGYISIYDIATDCAHPRLLNEGRGSLPGMRIPMLTHEGAFSPDGNTYWTSGQIWSSAVDVSDPTNPNVIWSAPAGLLSHGMDFTPDGDTIFMSTGAGVNILDTSAVQDRAAPGMTMHQLLPSRGHEHWRDGLFSQHSIYTTYGDTPVLFNVDEAGSGGVKVYDASDLSNLQWRSTIKLEINLPQHADRWAISAASSGFFGYESHYCSVDRRENPRLLACGWMQSGVRVFDVRDPGNVREVAYYNPPAQTGKRDELPNSEHVRFGGDVVPPVSGIVSVPLAILRGQITGADITDQARIIGLDLSADWCASPPEFRGDMLYVTCSDNGFMTLRMDPSVIAPR